MGRQGSSAQRDRITIIDEPINRMLFSFWVKVLGLSFVHAPYHDLGAR